MSENVPILYVDIKRSKTTWPIKRPQQYFAVIKSAGNFKTTFRSNMFTNYQDCVDAARLVGSRDTTVILRCPETGNEVLRYSDLLDTEQKISDSLDPQT